MNAPLPFTWDGEAMQIDPRFRKQADAEFVIGERYRLAIHEERSRGSHNHYFLAINAIWENLPEHQAERFPTAEHLRKYALIRAGYRDERSIVCASKAEAARVAAFIKPMDEYAVVTVSEAVVRVWTAKSQSYKAMGKEVFQASKDAVLETLAGMIDLTPRAVAEHVSSEQGHGAKTPALAG